MFEFCNNNILDDFVFANIEVYPHIFASKFAHPRRVRMPRTKTKEENKRARERGGGGEGRYKGYRKEKEDGDGRTYGKESE